MKKGKVKEELDKDGFLKKESTITRFVKLRNDMNYIKTIRAKCNETIANKLTHDDKQLLKLLMTTIDDVIERSMELTENFMRKDIEYSNEDLT